MLAKVVSFGLKGVEGYKIDIETDVSNGLPHFEIVGLADTAIKEAKERVRSGIKNSGLVIFEEAGHFCYLDDFYRFDLIAKKFFGVI